MGAADALGARLAQPEKAHLALLDEPAHRTDRVLDRDGGVDPVLVIEVDDVDAEALERGFARLLNVFRPAVDPARAAVLAEFGGEDDTLATPFERAPKQLLVLPEAVGVRAVEKIDAEVDRLVKKGHRRGI